MIEELLNHNIHRPAQYIGHEWNTYKKDFNSCAISFALGFPDLYEIGMSNLGLRIIYGVLNNINDVVCERFFSPEADMQEYLKNSNQRLFSLESGRQILDFDIVGFSLGSELNYTNVLSILELAAIPLESSQRNYKHPLIIAGGPCTLNPEPMADFFDLFIIGEAEEVVVELLEAWRKFKNDYKSGKLEKKKLLIELSKIEGVYAPCLDKDPSTKIKKRVVSDFNSAYFPCNWLLPYVQTVHDRITLEVMRGCPNRCRFCQARSQYYPLRLRDKETVVSLAQSAYASTGYEEISLAGLSVSDYPQLTELISKLTAIFKEPAVNLSLPSLKAKALLGDVSGLIAKIKKTGLTFAPEAGTQRMRDVLAKDFQEEEFFEAIAKAYASGYQHLKLYFLIGLPGEKEEDLKGIIDFANKASELRRKISGSPAQINVSINPLIPKPHTPFQWLKMDSLMQLKQKRDFLYQHCKNRRIKFNFHNFEMAFLEAVLSRGDRKLGKVIHSAFKNGAKFDAWSNSFSQEKWLNAFSEQGIDPQAYLNGRSVDEPLAWDFIDTGISRENLLLEFNKSIAI